MYFNGNIYGESESRFETDFEHYAQSNCSIAIAGLLFFFHLVSKSFRIQIVFSLINKPHQ